MNKTYSRLFSASLLIIALILIISSCKHEPAILPDLTNNNGGNNGGGNNNNNNNNGVTCDPDTAYFQNSVLPIFLTNCAVSGCHDANTAEEGIILDSYSNIMNTGNIQPFNVNHGHIYKSITENDPGDRMPPPPKSALTQQQINLIADWINQGALNNGCNSCDTSNVTYNGTISPLLQNKCVGCHNSSSSSGGVNLATYAGTHAVAISGSLYGAVHHDAGYIAMPPGGNSLPSCEVDQIRIWIQNGASYN